MYRNGCIVELTILLLCINKFRIITKLIMKWEKTIWSNNIYLLIYYKLGNIKCNANCIVDILSEKYGQLKNVLSRYMY